VTNLTASFFPLPAIHSFSAPVPKHNLTCEVADKDGVVSKFKQLGQVVQFQRLLLEHLFSPFTLGNLRL